MTKQYRLVALCLAILFSIPILSAQEADTTATAAPSEDAGLVAAGAALFDVNCTQCHQVHKKIIGPALAGINDRLEESWLIPWIKNSQKVIASGDEYANQIYQEYARTQMQAFNLSDDEILSILAYVKDESAKCPDPTNPDCPDYVQGPNNGGGGDDKIGQQDSPYITAILVIMVIILGLVLVVLGMIVSVLTKYLKEQKGLGEADLEMVSQKMDFPAYLKSNAFLGLVVFIFTVVALKTLIDGAFTIGVQQGYQPTQPINFSHEIHAGQYEIDCNYCHTGVRKSKSANIPSPNICMNCHSEIKPESIEVQKIYAAVDYNPMTKEYGTDTKPIEWVRIHNLPDLAYFNHSQHVEVGEVECQTCHGPIEEMDVVYQYSNLTMGWCISCHRETDVNTRGNGYYDKLVELHKEKSKEPMKVEDIGGLECSKCHY